MKKQNSDKYLQFDFVNFFKIFIVATDLSDEILYEYRILQLCFVFLKYFQLSPNKSVQRGAKQMQHFTLINHHRVACFLIRL